jgi:hypothetical protein
MIKTIYRLGYKELKSRKRRTLTGHYAYDKLTSEKAYRIKALYALKNWKQRKITYQ